jgi:cysteine desulfurase / selenocysteine lyase
VKVKQPGLQDKIIYLDNAATSWPKPPEVSNAVKNFIDTIGANPGRSGHHMSVKAARIVYSARKEISNFFNGPDPLRVIFTSNITEALNTVLLGFLHPGDHVITSCLEHNSVMRPLRFLESKGVELTVIESPTVCRIDPQEIEVNIRKNTKLIVINHASNVTGTILPVREIGKIARKHKLLLMTDEAQTGGAYPVDMEEDYIDLLAFTGHKSLLGPTGTGGLILGRRVNHLDINPLIRGGTGSNSEKEEQPEILPDRFESGTLNACGLAGLTAALNWITKTELSSIRTHEVNLCQRLIDGLNEITGVKVHGGWIARDQTATVSFTIPGIDNAKIGLMLDDTFGILCRIGLHCSPAAHKTLGTYPDGTVRLSIGYFNNEQEIDKTIRAIQKIAQEAK